MKKLTIRQEWEEQHRMASAMCAHLVIMRREGQQRILDINAKITLLIKERDHMESTMANLDHLEFVYKAKKAEIERELHVMDTPASAHPRAKETKAQKLNRLKDQIAQLEKEISREQSGS